MDLLVLIACYFAEFGRNVLDLVVMDPILIEPIF